MYSTLVDLRLVTWSPTTEEARRFLHQIGTLSAIHGRRGPVAIVATQPMLFGMSRMRAALSDQAAGQIGTFYELAEAERWLAAQQVPTT